MLAVIRIRGSIHLRAEMNKTLALLGLNRVNRMNVVPESDSFKKMLKKAEAFVTWGEISQKTLEKALKKRGKESNSKGLSGEFLKKHKLKSFKELAEKIEKGSTLKSLGIKPVALNPPSKGFERGGIKRAYSIGGALGYRGKAINELVERMI